MDKTLTHRAAVIGISLTLIFFGAGCTKKKGAVTSEAWLSEFSTITTSVTDAFGWDLGLYGTTDPSGNLYLTGSTANGWVLIKSTDGGTNWNQEFTEGPSGYGYRVVSDSQGNVFAVGSTNTYPHYGTIKKYTASTGLWSTVYSAQIETGKLTFLQGVAVDSNDHIYVTGDATVTLLSPDGWPDMGVTKMIVLKSTDHGSTWNLIDSFAVDDYGYTSGIDVYASGTGEVYAYGRAQYSARSNSFVRKSTDAGATWTRIYEDFGTAIRGLAAWGNNLILSEDFYDGPYHSIAARMKGTSDTFGTLALLDSYSPEGNVEILTGAMKVDSKGHVYYPLRYTDADGLSHLVLRGNKGDGEWVTLDDYVAATDEAFYASEVLIGHDDSVYNLGAHATAAGTTWFLRKATLGSTSSVTPEDVGDADAQVSPAPAGAKRIYITSLTHDGNWGTTPTSAIANADAACNSDPNMPLNGAATYKAMLVNSARRACSTANCSGGASENLDWVFAPNTDYVSREGVALGTTDSSGIFSNFSRALLTNHVNRVWTGLETNARNWTVEADVCGNWTSNDGLAWSTIWTPRASDFGDIYTGGAWITCETEHRLLCVEQ